MKSSIWIIFVLVMGCAQPMEESESVPFDVMVHRYETNPAFTRGKARFLPLDIFIASEAAVGAYQVELVVEKGTSEIVGVEGATLPGFTEPPLYDPEALNHRRIILAAYNTEKSIPAGRHRVATVHMLETGNSSVMYRLKTIAAANDVGKPVQFQAELAGREN